MKKTLGIIIHLTLPQNPVINLLVTGLAHISKCLSITFSSKKVTVQKLEYLKPGVIIVTYIYKTISTRGDITWTTKLSLFLTIFSKCGDKLT